MITNIIIFDHSYSQFIIVSVTYILTLTLFAISFKFYEELKLSSWRDVLPGWPSIQTSMEILYVSYHLPLDRPVSLPSQKGRVKCT